jgi:hypothetical protein
VGELIGAELPTVDVVAWAGYLANLAGESARAITTAAQIIDAELVAQAATFASNMQNVVALLSDTLKFVGELIGAELPTVDVVAWAGYLANLAGESARAITTAAQIIDAKLVADAATFSDQMRDVISLLRDTLKFVGDLAKTELPEVDIAAVGLWLVDFATKLIQTVGAAALLIDDAMLAQVLAFSNRVADTIWLLQDVLGFMADLGNAPAAVSLDASMASMLKFLSDIIAAVQGMGTATLATFPPMATVIANAMDAISLALWNVANDVQYLIERLNGLFDVCNGGLPNPFRDLSGWAFDAAGDAQTVSDAVNNVWDVCNGGLPNPFSDFGGWADAAVSAIWSVIDALGDLGGAQDAAGNPGYATGTFSAAGGFAMVGEAGPELMFVPRGNRIMSAGELASGGGGRGGGVTNNTTNRSGDTIVIQDQASMALLLSELRRGRMGRMADRF